MEAGVSKGQAMVVGAMAVPPIRALTGYRVGGGA